MVGGMLLARGLRNLDTVMRLAAGLADVKLPKE